MVSAIGRVFEFVEHWWLPAAPEQLRDVITDLEHYPQWWPEVVAVAKLGPDDARVLCRSRLPYTLDLVLHAVSRDLPVLEVTLSGHLRGWVRWRLEPARSEGREGTRLVLTQRVSVHGPITPFAVLLRPLARWNHARMMAGAHAGLLARLRAPAAEPGGGQDSMVLMSP